MEPQEIGVRAEISQIWTLGRGSLQENPIYIQSSDHGLPKK